jgi:hypothetical protein
LLDDDQRRIEEGGPTFSYWGSRYLEQLYFILQELPEFRQVVLAPGKQLPKDVRSDLVMVAVFSGM